VRDIATGMLGGELVLDSRPAQGFAASSSACPS